MTSSLQDQGLEAYVPVYDVVPEQWEDSKAFITEQLKRIANAVNVRVIGWLLDEELLTGQQFIPGNNIPGDDSPRQFRSVLRKVIDFGALPNAGSKSVLHGINFDSNFTLMKIYAAATNPIGLVAIPIPYVSNTPNQSVELLMTSTNVVITTATNYTAFTRCYVVIEYIQEL